MMPLYCLSLTLLAATAQAADSQSGQTKQAGVDIEARATGGYLSGHGVRTDTAAVALIAVSAEPFVQLGDVELALPVAVRHRETFGAALRETRGQVFAAAGWHGYKALRPELKLGVLGVWRPGWPDLYQPDGDTFLPTDRHSFFAARGSARLKLHPARRHWGDVRYRWRHVDYKQDPNFDIDDSPNHLVPADHRRHELQVGWRYSGGLWKIGLEADLFSRRSATARARDAGTGKTHATTDNPNPLQVLRGVEPALEGTLRLWSKRIRLRLRYGYEVVDDTFQGYYSYQGHHPELDVRLEMADLFEVRLGVEGRWRTYGANSYAATPEPRPDPPPHPALDFGDRRVDRRLATRLRLRVPLSDLLAIVAEGKVTVRRTNFPDYVPGVFPRTRQYAIDWDYDNWMVVAGLDTRI